MGEKKLLKETAKLVKKDFEIELSDSFITEEQLEIALAERVYYLIEHDLERLFSILYRLDVNEQKVHNALKLENIIPPALAIARLIINRQKEKARTRLLYSQDEPDFEEDVSEW